MECLVNGVGWFLCNKKMWVGMVDVKRGFVWYLGPQFCNYVMINRRGGRKWVAKVLVEWFGELDLPNVVLLFLLPIVNWLSLSLDSVYQTCFCLSYYKFLTSYFWDCILVEFVNTIVFAIASTCMMYVIDTSSRVLVLNLCNCKIIRTETLMDYYICSFCFVLIFFFCFFFV